jgi:hypothetical protein
MGWASAHLFLVGALKATDVFSRLLRSPRKKKPPDCSGGSIAASVGSGAAADSRKTAVYRDAASDQGIVMAAPLES